MIAERKVDMTAPHRLVETRTVDVPELDRSVTEIDGTLTRLTLEWREWTCPICKAPQHYLIANGRVVKGWGPLGTHYHDRVVEHCDKPTCRETARKILGVP